MIEIIIAHLVGDWLLQNRYMAVAKGKQTLVGWGFCLLHVMIYTLCFYVIVPGKTQEFYLSVFLPHFIIDKWSLAQYWMRLKNGKYWWETYNMHDAYKHPTFMQRVDMGLSGLQYAVEDNTLHLICLYMSFNYFSG